MMSSTEYHDEVGALPAMECKKSLRQRQDSGIELPDDWDLNTCCEGAEGLSVDSGVFDFEDFLAVLDATQDDKFIGDVYETLCSTRVSQMTKTYNDIGAVTRLLEEKERDLELAARIGQTLLERNKELSNKNEDLEQELTEVQEKHSQLKHELVMKDALLQVYVQDYEGAESEPSTPEGKVEHTLEALQKKVKTLEDQNSQLKIEAVQLDNETSNYEEQEQSLVSTCVRQLDELNDRVDLMAEELVAKGDVNLMQQEEISMLLGQTINLEGKNKKLVVDNAELNQHLAAAQEAQRQLTAELAELEEKYQECMALLQEAQEEIKALRKKQKPSVARQHYSTFSPFGLEGSLASELEDSFRKDLNAPSGRERKSHSKKVMETAKYVRRTAQQSGSLQSLDKGSSGNDSCESIAGSDTRSSLYLSENESQMSDGYGADTDSLYSIQGSTNLGRPGIPGSNDLETALRRLTLRKANEINEKMFEEDQRMKKRTNHRMHSDSSTTPTECYTPDSFMSTGSGSNVSDFSRLSGFRFPDKLQIVKPMEGSLTLHRWQRLATPHLGGLLEQRPGVQIKGQDKAEVEEEEEVYSLSDYEEDGTWTHVNPTEHAQASSDHFQARASNNDGDSDQESSVYAVSEYSIVKHNDDDDDMASLASLAASIEEETGKNKRGPSRNACSIM